MSSAYPELLILVKVISWFFSSLCIFEKKCVKKCMSENISSFHPDNFGMLKY